MRYLKTILLLSVIAISSSGCALYHHYGPYYGKVVDADTQKPLEGAVVLADYVTWLWGSPGGPSVYFLDAQEVVTDTKGEFRIPSLNAFAFRPISAFDPQAHITIFKPRYQCYTLPVPEDRYEPIGLKELKSREERLKYTGCYPESVPYEKMRKLIEQYNIERSELGLQQVFKEMIK